MSAAEPAACVRNIQPEEAGSPAGKPVPRGQAVVRVALGDEGYEHLLARRRSPNTPLDLLADLVGHRSRGGRARQRTAPPAHRGPP